jgi:uncharacterized protein DUF1963
MTDDLTGLDAEALRRRYVEMVLLHDKTGHVGRQNRIFGWCNDIGKQLVALGDASERELLPLLDHPSPAVRRSAAFDIRPLNRELFVATLEALVRGGGWIARQAHLDLELTRSQETRAAEPPEPMPAPDPNWLKIVNWQEINPPPTAISRAHFEERALSEFSAERARQILALARLAIGLWPQRQPLTESPLASRHGGDVWAPRDWQWPIWEEEPMYFLGQIYCPDLAGLPGAELLPREGLLAFFGDFDAIAGCEPAGSVEQGAVYHWPEANLVATEPPLPLGCPKEQVATPLLFRPFIDLPDPFSEIIRELMLNDAEKELYCSLRKALREHGIPQNVVNYCDLASKIFGWPALVQGDFRLPHAGVDVYRQLVQLPARLGPGGSLYFFIRDTDLAAHCFDKCILEEQST